MEHKVDYLEKTVEDTDRKLETLSWRMERWERAVSEVSLIGDPEMLEEAEQESCVMNLLQDVTQVREDYEQLRSDITEIQHLQRELTNCLKMQLNQVHAKYGFLRSKLGPSLPSTLMMSSNTYQHSPVKQNGTVTMNGNNVTCEQKHDLRDMADMRAPPDYHWHFPHNH